MNTLKKFVRNWYSQSSVSTFRYQYNNLYRLHDWEEENFFFIHIPKNAGTSICKALNKIDPGHFQYTELRKRGMLDNKSTIYCVLRDPVQRIESIYNYALTRKQGGDNFLSWVAQYESADEFALKGLNSRIVDSVYFFWSQAYFVDSGADSRIVYLNYEYLSESFERLATKVGTSAKLPYANKSAFKDEITDPDALCRVKSLYKEDYSLMENVSYI